MSKKTGSSTGTVMFLFVYVASPGWDCRNLLSTHRLARLYQKCGIRIGDLFLIYIIFRVGGAEHGIVRINNRDVLRPVPIL